MDSSSATRHPLERAVILQREGALDEAEDLYRQVLAVSPTQPDALHLLGVVRLRAGMPDEAVALITRAIGQREGVATYHNNLGNALLALGRAADARRSYEHALAIAPDYALAHVNLGHLHHGAGDFQRAIECHERALALEPRLADAHAKLADTLRALGRMSEALARYEIARSIDARHVHATRCIGDLRAAQGDASAAVAAYRDALAVDPADAPALTNLGNLLHAMGDLGAAAGWLRQACAASPQSALPQLALGNVLQDLRDFDAAIAAYERTLTLAPDLAIAWHNIGIAHAARGDLSKSIRCLRQALALDDSLTATLAHLVHQLQHACDWSDLPELQAKLVDALEATAPADVPPFLLLSIPCDAKLQLAAARRHAAAIAAASVQERRRLAFTHGRGPREILRIGYLSADFSEHATSYLVAELFERHDRGRFLVHGYSYGPDDRSPTRRRIAAGCDRFADLRGADDASAARRIHDDGVDILVDLKGYTRFARPAIAALRPAPIQAQWLGYPGSLGADWIDYAIVDETVVPPSEASTFAERLIHLPCYWVSDTRRVLPAPPTRAQVGLPEHAFVYCCFNQCYKLTPQTYALWLRLLHVRPDSVLWLIDPGEIASRNLHRSAVEAGIDAERIVFAPFVDAGAHAARIALANLALDTLPYNGHTTSSDALRAGVPVLTQAGDTFAGRVTASQLRAVGLPELVTPTAADYEALARRLAAHPAQLAQLCARLARPAPGGLFDTAHFTRMLEQAYRAMWEDFASGVPLNPF